MLAAAARNHAFAPWSDAENRERTLDLVHLARQTDGDAALEAELLAMFDSQAEKLAERVKLADVPRRARGDIAHRLKGSALAIGAFAVARAAAELEAAFEHDAAEPLAEIAALATAVAEARSAIARLRG